MERKLISRKRLCLEEAIQTDCSTLTFHHLPYEYVITIVFICQSSSLEFADTGGWKSPHSAPFDRHQRIQARKWNTSHLQTFSRCCHSFSGRILCIYGGTVTAAEQTFRSESEHIREFGSHHWNDGVFHFSISFSNHFFTLFTQVSVPRRYLSFALCIIPNFPFSATLEIQKLWSRRMADTGMLETRVQFRTNSNGIAVNPYETFWIFWQLYIRFRQSNWEVIEKRDSSESSWEQIARCPLVNLSRADHSCCTSDLFFQILIRLDHVIVMLQRKVRQFCTDVGHLA
jgi:hypothetical protein